MKKILCCILLTTFSLNAALDTLAKDNNKITCDGTVELDEIDQQITAENVASQQAIIAVQEILDNITNLIASHEDADLITAYLAQLILTILSATQDIDVQELSETDLQPCQLISRPILRQIQPFQITIDSQMQTIEEQNTPTEAIVSTVANIATNVTNILIAPKNPRVVSMSIANILAALVKIICSARKHAKDEKVMISN